MLKEIQKFITNQKVDIESWLNDTGKLENSNLDLDQIMQEYRDDYEFNFGIDVGKIQLLMELEQLLEDLKEEL